MRLLSFLHRLLRRQPLSPAGDRPPAPACPLSRSGVEVDEAPQRERQPGATILIAPLPEVPAEEDEDDWGREDQEEDLDGEPDPFIKGTGVAIGWPVADVAALRAKARAEALRGEHRLPLARGAGPGSLAEALNILVGEGRVEAEFIDDPVEGPIMVYRPITSAS